MSWTGYPGPSYVQLVVKKKKKPTVTAYTSEVGDGQIIALLPRFDTLVAFFARVELVVLQ